MGYRCWTCREDITGGAEVWLDAYGRAVDWGKPVRHIDPAPHHITCQRDPILPGDPPPDDVVTFHERPIRFDPPSAEAVAKKQAEKDTFTLDSLPKPREQLKLF